MSKKSNIFITFLSLLLWEILMRLIIPENGSVLKSLITSLLWISFIASAINFYTYFYSLKKYISKINYQLITLLIIWNFINIFRSIVNGDSNFLTTFGNPFTVLSLLIPFAVFYGLKLINLIYIRDILLKSIKLGIYCIPLFFINNKFAGLGHLFTGYFFLSPSVIIENKKNIYLILTALIIVFLTSLSSRTTLVRIALYAIPFIMLFLQKKYYFKNTYKFTFLLLIFPIYFTYSGFNHGNTIFEYFSSKSDNELYTDTRSFLFEEVFEDLNNNNKLLIGKGAASNYFSNYFTNNLNVKNNRLTVEVGILTILLKGGIIALLLNLSIFFIAIYMAYFKSNNTYSKTLGFLLLVHVVLLFVENVVAYNIYNFIIWFTVGVCLNKQFRLLNNFQIKYIINGRFIKNINNNTQL